MSFNIETKFSTVSTTHFGNSLVATMNLSVGTIVQTFVTEPTEKAFNGNLDAPLDERHVISIGHDSNGKILYGKVISDAKYVNHSCNPNCKVNINKEIYTIKDVKQNEELTIAYDEGSGKWESSWNFKCLCLSSNCRGLINSFKITNAIESVDTLSQCTIWIRFVHID